MLKYKSNITKLSNNLKMEQYIYKLKFEHNDGNCESLKYKNNKYHPMIRHVK